MNLTTTAQGPRGEGRPGPRCRPPVGGWRGILLDYRHMRVLIACTAGCQRQYDASELARGSRFHCACGEVLTVPRPGGFEASVVRCSACGAPRQAGEALCGHCDASFTLVDRDLNTVCPQCMARVGDRARFCHHCAAPLTAEEVAGEVSRLGCPSCGQEEPLVSRQLGRQALSFLECHRCAGMWLSAETFRILEERAQASSAEAPPKAGPAAPVPTAGAVAYRPCPVCEKLMHRRNYGRKSGVIVDRCHDHGTWFDHRELDRILSWIRQGGLSRAKILESQELEEKARQRRRASLDEPSPTPSSSRRGADFFDVLDVLTHFF